MWYKGMRASKIWGVVLLLPLNVSKTVKDPISCQNCGTWTLHNVKDIFSGCFHMTTAAHVAQTRLKLVHPLCTELSLFHNQQHQTKKINGAFTQQYWTRLRLTKNCITIFTMSGIHLGFYLADRFLKEVNRTPWCMPASSHFLQTTWHLYLLMNR